MLKNLYLFVGPSGVGKTTVVNLLKERRGLVEARSYTTRKQRGPDDYYTFITKEEFNAIPDLVERVEYCGNYYGLGLSALSVADCAIVEPEGAEQIKRVVKDREVKIIGLCAPASHLFQRLQKGRDDGGASLARVEKDQELFACLTNIADCLVRSLDIEETYESVSTYIDRTEATG